MIPVISEATETDFTVIGRLGRAFVSDSISRRFITYNGDGFVDIIKSMVVSGIVKVWVAKFGELMIGALGLLISPNLYNPNEMLADVMFIDVIPDYRRLGVGGMLLDVAESHARKSGIIAISVSFKTKEIANKVVASHRYTMFEYKLMKRVGD